MSLFSSRRRIGQAAAALLAGFVLTGGPGLLNPAMAQEATPTSIEFPELTPGIAPTLAVMIDNVDRGNELPCNPHFARALAEELVPWLRERYLISHDPAAVTLAGQSYGGLASLYCAFQHPETFGNVLSQSGSFWWKPNPLDSLVIDVIGDAPVYQWLNSEIARRPAAPIRVFMEAGLVENRSGADGAPTLLQSNRNMRDILIAKGYDVTYREFSGDHDYSSWRSRLPEALVALRQR